MAGFWADVPPGRMAHLVGASPEAITLALEPLPADAPAVLTCQITGDPSSSRVVAAVLDQLERAALDLFPAWLPGAEVISGPGGAGVHAVRALATRKAAGTPHFGPFLADLAARAIGGGATANRFPDEVRLAGLGRVIADSFERSSTALLMLAPDRPAPEAGQALLAAGRWLAHRGGIAVWLAGTGLPTADRVRQIQVHLPEHVADLAEVEVAEAAEQVTGPAVLRVPAIVGRPHPGSEAEQVLEVALAAVPWATGRAWNQTFQTDPLANPVRIDLLWRAERLAVEIDGAEHRSPAHYEADRRRDTMLQLAGFSVVRFTNTQTLTDTGAVLAQLELLLTMRRQPGKDGHAR